MPQVSTSVEPGPQGAGSLGALSRQSWPTRAGLAVQGLSPAGSAVAGQLSQWLLYSPPQKQKLARMGRGKQNKNHSC